MFQYRILNGKPRQIAFGQSNVFPKIFLFYIRIEANIRDTLSVFTLYKCLKNVYISSKYFRFFLPIFF